MSQMHNMTCLDLPYGQVVKNWLRMRFRRSEDGLNASAARLMVCKQSQKYRRGDKRFLNCFSLFGE
jgi:hypothetical protein